MLICFFRSWRPWDSSLWYTVFISWRWLVTTITHHKWFVRHWQVIISGYQWLFWSLKYIHLIWQGGGLPYLSFPANRLGRIKTDRYSFLSTLLVLRGVDEITNFLLIMYIFPCLLHIFFRWKWNHMTLAQKVVTFRGSQPPAENVALHCTLAGYDSFTFGHITSKVIKTFILTSFRLQLLIKLILELVCSILIRIVVNRWLQIHFWHWYAIVICPNFDSLPIVSCVVRPFDLIITAFYLL